MRSTDPVVIIGASTWGGVPLMEQHLALELARKVRVLYVNPPVSALSSLRNSEVRRLSIRPGLQPVHDALQVLTVQQPPLKDHPRVKPFSLPLFVRSIRRALRSLGAPGVRATIVASMDPVLGALGERTSIYLAKDDYVAGADLTGLPKWFVESNVAVLCAAADRVVCVTPTLAAVLEGRGADTTVLPHGVDVNRFVVGAPTQGERRACFVGHLSDRIDTRLLAAVVARGIPLTMVGPTQETMGADHLAALSGSADVDWVGAVPHDRLGEQLREVTTCLVPYTDSDFNRSSFPLKLLEYLAAGRRVVSTPLPALDLLATPLIEIAHGPERYAAAVESSLASPLEPAEIAARRAFAAGHSWGARAARLLEIIEEHES